MICLQISCWRLLYLLLQVDRMGGRAQLWLHLPPCLPLSLSFFILQSVFEQGCPTPYRTVDIFKTGYLHSSFFKTTRTGALEIHYLYEYSYKR